jgi:hypothetical protein
MKDSHENAAKKRGTRETPERLSPRHLCKPHGRAISEKTNSSPKGTLFGKVLHFACC